MTCFRKLTLGTALALLAGSVLSAPVVEGLHTDKKDEHADSGLIERGRYLVIIGGCNDCHTPDFAMSQGKVSEKDWLIGDKLGWRGPWGTTYPSNLRLFLQGISEDQWLTVARTAQLRPPMPGYILRQITEQDLRAIYRFIRSLGAAGEPAPAYVPPDQVPNGPYVLFPEPPKS